eukprot:13571089-Alexandrium_andersonii.AAC.1
MSKLTWADAEDDDGFALVQSRRGPRQQRGPLPRPRTGTTPWQQRTEDSAYQNQRELQYREKPRPGVWRGDWAPRQPPHVTTPG